MCRSEALHDIKAASPSEGQQLDSESVDLLRTHTQALLEADRDEALLAYKSFSGTQNSGLEFDAEAMAEHIGGKRILITGASGCVGSALRAELSRFRPASIASLGKVSLMDHIGQGRVDVRDGASIHEQFSKVKPHIVYHLAGQRNVGAAQTDLQSTFETNITGTMNVLHAALQYGASNFVYASSEKALSPYVTDAYGISKKTGEWILSATAEQTDTSLSIARFAHIVDNSVVFGLMQQWAHNNEPIKLFDSKVSFYTQTAREAAYTLMVAGLEGESPIAKIVAAKNLGDPTNLVDLALGVIADVDSQSPIYFSEPSPGYKAPVIPPSFKCVDFPRTMPLIGRLEVPRMKNVQSCDNMTSFPAAVSTKGRITEIVKGLENQETETVFEIKSHLSEALLDATLENISEATVLEIMKGYEYVQGADANIIDQMRRNLAGRI